jgi:hypothetical protein
MVATSSFAAVVQYFCYVEDVFVVKDEQLRFTLVTRSGWWQANNFSPNIGRPDAFPYIITFSFLLCLVKKIADFLAELVF